MFTSRSNQIARLEARLRAAEETIDRLCASVGIDSTPRELTGRLDAEELQYLHDGQPIRAIKHHRERTGSSLVEAKAAVDRAARES